MGPRTKEAIGVAVVAPTLAIAVVNGKEWFGVDLVIPALCVGVGAYLFNSVMAAIELDREESRKRGEK